MSKVKIIIADDQKIICEGLAVMLNQQSDLEVIATANSGEDVINKTIESKPDVILMDIRMPGIGGIRAAKILKEKYPDIKIIMLTTFSQNDYILKALKNGASGYLLKDTDVHQLVDAIYQSLKGQILIPESIQPLLMKQLETSGENDSRSSFETVLDALKERNVRLTDTETNILKRLLNGYSNQEIADSMYLSIGTVKNYVSKVYRKLGVSGRPEAILLLKSL
ncbi:response regulator transcription factor [Gracilibacillus thailandensis]|uniref:Response regulator n=1 Tax=Gracilibacillus thailandensis TaxID=563735 RepID=A0A6N7QS93_9BACI|nr:response regulator transcription factor [Gracilibacillus thailandensis]MRI64893.1 response regulator [Gracilibacillus thailandensis]